MPVVPNPHKNSKKLLCKDYSFCCWRHSIRSQWSGKKSRTGLWKKGAARQLRRYVKKSLRNLDDA